jgi:outer membrane protein TolC
VLVRAVLERNPTLEAARQAWLAAAERPTQVSALERPMVSYGFAPLSIGSGVLFGQEVELSQGIPLGGRRRARAAVATAEAAVLEADLETMRQELAKRAALLFVDYALAAESIRINDEHGVLLEDLLRSATSRYAAGLGSQQDPLAAESELAHVLHEGVELRSEQRIVAAQINTLLHRAPAAPLPPPSAPPPVEAHSHAMFDPAHDEQAALDRRPELRSAAAAIEARRAEVDSMLREGRPELELMTSYESMWSDREHRWMVGGAIGLPLWRRGIRAGVAEAEAKLAQAESEHAARQQEVRSDAWQAAERLHESEHILELYRDRMLPIAVDRVEAALAGLRSGRNDFAAVIEAERNRREVDLGYQQALASIERNRIELARASGDDAAASSSAAQHDAAPSGPGDEP